MLALLLPLLTGTLGLADAPEASVTYAFEVLALDLHRSDALLTDYGFQPIGAAPLLSHSVVGTFTFREQIRVGLHLRTATAVRGDAADVPTVVQGSWTGVHAGRALTPSLWLGGDLGFGAVSASVGSPVQGGALVYLGPYLQPRLSWRLVDGPGVVELSAGWMLHTPLGPAHDNPLWEASFDRGLIQGPTVAIHSGLGTGGWQ